MKKKNYEKPQIQVIEVDQTEIICVSTSTETLGEGDPIFGGSSAKDRLFFDEEY